MIDATLKPGSKEFCFQTTSENSDVWVSCRKRTIYVRTLLLKDGHHDFVIQACSMKFMGVTIQVFIKTLECWLINGTMQTTHHYQEDCLGCAVQWIVRIIPACGQAIISSFKHEISSTCVQAHLLHVLSQMPRLLEKTPSASSLVG